MHAHMAPSRTTGRPAPARTGGARLTDPRHTAGNAALNRARSVQRTLTYEERHSAPAGTSLRLRGPGSAGVVGATPNKINDADAWQELVELYNHVFSPANPGQARTEVQLDEPPEQLVETHSSPLRRMLVAKLASVADHIGGMRGQLPGGSMARLGVLSGLDPRTWPYYRRQQQRDKSVAENAVATRARYDNTAGPAFAQAMAGFTRNTLAHDDDARTGAQTLLSAADGLAVGGMHSSPAVWNFLNGDLTALMSAGVDTVYLESVKDDQGLQPLIDDYLRGAAMDPRLDTFLTNYASNYVAAGPRLRAFLERAQGTGLRVRALDGRPARSQGDGMHTRAVMFNEYAAETIRQDPGRRGKYVAELGARHLGTHTATGPASVEGVTLPATFPGVDELLGIPGVGLDDSNALLSLGMKMTPANP